MSTPGDESLHHLIDLIYQAALDPERWPLVLKGLTSALGSTHASLFIHDFDSQFVQADATGTMFRTVGFEDWAVARYAEHFSARNVWIANETRLGSGNVVTSSMLYPDDELSRTDFYGDWLQPQNLFYSLGGIVDRRGAQASKLSVLRSRSQGAFEDSEVQFLQRLYPHVRRACELNQRIGLAEADGALGRLAQRVAPLCLFALSATGELLHANAQGEAWLRDSGILSIWQRRLVAVQSQHESALREALRRTTQDGAPVHINLGDLTNPGRCLTLMRMPPGERFAKFGTRAELLGLLGDSVLRPLASNDQLAELFGLSPAEARLARALAEGESLDTLSQSRQVSRNTLRAQLQSALGKTGTDSQRALIRLVLAVPAWAG